MDTGVGRTSYSIMAQGQIDQILSSKPEERRAVFEEAAGITKYKSQRREAMGKLALTEQNLARVADVIGEVGRQIGSLRRQAAKAMRYKRLGHRLRHLNLAWSASQHRRLSAALGELEATVASLRVEADKRRVSLDEQQAGVESKKQRRSDLNQRVQDAQQSVYDLRSKREQADNAANLAQMKRSGLQDRLGSSKESLGELEMQLREVSEQVDTGAQDKQMQLGLLGTSDAAFQQRNRELAVAEGELGKFDRELQQAKFELLQVDSTVARLRTDCSGYEVDQKTSIHRHEAVAQDLRQAAELAKAAAKVESESTARVEQANLAKAEATEESAAAQQTVADTTREFRDLQRRLQDIDRQIAQRGARLKLLQQLQERWEGFGEGAKAVLQGRLDSALAGSKASAITAGLDIRPEYGRAVEALLGTAAEAISVADLATARKILSQLEQEQIGSVILTIAEISRAGLPANVPAILEPAAAALSGAGDAHPARVLLSSCFIAKDLGAFLDFWRDNPGFEFLAVATLKGEVVDRRGLVSGGYANPRKQSNSIVQREIDRRETEKALVDEQRSHEEQKVLIDAVAARLSSAEQSLEEKRAGVLSAAQAAANAQAEDRNNRRTSEEAQSRVRRMEQDLVALEHARNEAQARWEKARSGLEAAEKSAADQRRRIESLESKIIAVRTDRDLKARFARAGAPRTGRTPAKGGGLGPRSGRDGKTQAPARRTSCPKAARDRGLGRADRSARGGGPGFKGSSRQRLQRPSGSRRSRWRRSGPGWPRSSGRSRRWRLRSRPCGCRPTRHIRNRAPRR